jgi:hypothetical protein
LVLRDCGAFVASFARYGRVRSDERKPVLMFLDRIYRNLPTHHRMALCAVRTKFAAMDVSVTI